MTHNPRSQARRAGANDSVRSIPFDWHMNGLMVEFKKSLKYDPFYTIEELEASNTPRDKWRAAKSDDKSLKVLGQLAHYASELFATQHRTHAFQLLIIGNFARYIYWDHSGAIVTERFDYTTAAGSKDLADFLWRFNHMTSARRGWNMTVSRPSSDEVDEFGRKVRDFIKRMEAKDDPQRHIEGAKDTLDEKYPPYKLAVAGNDLIIQRPFQVDRSPCGRGTRAYLAYNITSGNVAFLKDSWRVDITGLPAESLIYDALREKKVPFLPRVVAAEDVSYKEEVQRTRAQECALLGQQTSWWVPCSRSRRHIHHRVIQDLAYHLSTAMDSKEYTRAFRDVLVGKLPLLGAHRPSPTPRGVY